MLKTLANGKEELVDVTDSDISNISTFSIETDQMSVALTDEDPNNPLTPKSRAAKILAKKKEKKKQLLIENGIYIS